MLRAKLNTAVALSAQVEPSVAVPAAWPTGLACLGVTIAPCERCEVVAACDDWRVTNGAPKGMPPFCPDDADNVGAPKR